MHCNVPPPPRPTTTVTVVDYHRSHTTVESKSLTLAVSGRTTTWKACPWWRMETSVIRIFKLAILRSFKTSRNIRNDH
jgi:hypothetical protein